MQIQNFEIPVGWGQISGQIFGNAAASANSKPIIALHGFLDNSNSFKPLASFLTQDNQYYLIALDLPGMGFSSKIPNGIPYTTKFFVMSLRRVVLHFNLRRFAFLCHSFGCSLALAVFKMTNQQRAQLNLYSNCFKIKNNIVFGVLPRRSGRLATT